MATLLLGGIGMAACRGDGRDRPRDVASEGWKPVSENVRGVAVAEVQTAIGARVGGERVGTNDRQWRRVRELYEAYGNAPLFLGRDGIEDRARTVIAAVADAHTDALRAGAYPLEELRGALQAMDGRRPTAEQLANVDVMLTTVYVAYAEDMLTGQLDPRQVSQSWHIDPMQTDVDSAVARALREARFDQAFAAMRPQNEDYALLRRELERYRGIVANGGWNTVPEGPSLKPRERAPVTRLQALEARLSAEGLMDEATPAQPAAAPAPGQATAQQRAQVYDERLAGAVARFQARHNIVVDSILGAETVASLNKSADFRLAQIATNMERHRWLPRTLGQRYILVNVPAFRLHAYDAGQEALTMRVVVGSEMDERATPSFADSMSFIVFRPYWNVPDHIAEKEIYPKAASDPGYFERRRYEHAMDGNRRYVRQKPGDDNSLGLVKFMFPNDFMIYLHDTPEKALFQQDVRAASHGCIRLEKPDELARFVLGWDEARVRQAMESGADDQRVNLDQKIPVYIAYFTAYQDEGRLYFGNDVYARDDSIVEAVRAAAQPDPEATRIAEELRRMIG
jgi:murein L,D-transpeptidase YcbB/YkuD